jgi:hypothetical protein
MLRSLDRRRHPPGAPARRAERSTGRRRHASALLDDRTALEQAGWRTTLDFRENHRRDSDGVLSDVVQRWRGDAERSGPDGVVIVLSVEGPTPTAVWRRLRREAESDEVHGRFSERARR